MESLSSAEGPERSEAFGESWTPTAVDRFGIWLSSRRIRRAVRSFKGKRVGDFGCGFHATFVRSVLPEVEHAVLVDVSLAPDLLADPRITAIEGTLPETLADLPGKDLDVVLCMSVLEHLWDPQQALADLRELARPGGVCVFNVPTWMGKRFLELSAFRLHLSPPAEMNDHKHYFDPRDLWPMLVKAGFRPQDIQCRRHKFGLNTIAVCRVTE